jgi:hypothetical protein
VIAHPLRLAEILLGDLNHAPVDLDSVDLGPRQESPEIGGDRAAAGTCASPFVLADPNALLTSRADTGAADDPDDILFGKFARHGCLSESSASTPLGPRC